MDYLRLLQFVADNLCIICFGLFVDYFEHGLFEIIITGLFVNYLKQGLFEIICG